uniref:NADH dehydrogenase [ubiquinone] 1 beta subcomplex subunit 2, mitochondrial n=1 Tax=Cyprinus carpio carpio TaxID=630221 RepID=A0A8C1FGB6_CYPCA
MSSLRRTAGVLRTGLQLLRRAAPQMSVRKAGGGPHIEPQYRQPPQLTKNQKFQAELLSGAMWFWILWHFWHDPDAVLVSGNCLQIDVFKHLIINRLPAT